jgi:hypothetical protein
VGVDVLDLVGLGDLALRVDQVGEAAREIRPVVLGRTLGLIRLPGRPFCVGQQPELEVELLCEGFVLLGSVEGDTDDVGTQEVEV